LYLTGLVNCLDGSVTSVLTVAWNGSAVD